MKYTIRLIPLGKLTNCKTYKKQKRLKKLINLQIPNLLISLLSKIFQLTFQFFKIYLTFLRMQQILSMSKEFHRMFHKEKFHVFYSLDIFRPFPGFRGVRLVYREDRNKDKIVYCFVDF